MRPNISDFDPHFKVFHELMPFRVREILLVSSPYDAYILEEDGSLASRIINEYHGLNLSMPPRITRAATAEQALEFFAVKQFDLVVTMPHLGGMDGFTFAAHIKKEHGDIPVILLAHSVRDVVFESEPALDNAIDNTYVWCCDSDILLAIVKSVEDKKNVDPDTRKAMVRIILLVEDNAIYRSRLLPLLYHEVVRQTQSVLEEGLNEQHRLLKMRARPKILTASSYEEALELFDRYSPYIFGVMSDVRFRKGGSLSDDAGFLLMQKFRQEVPDLPLLMLSTDPANRQKALDVPAVFVEKNSAFFRQEIHNFFLNYLGFGDFVFRTPDGSELGRAENLHVFEEMLRTLPEESLRYHARNNHFSNWIMARAEISLASRLHKSHFKQMIKCEELREDIIFKIHALRKLRQQGIVAQFNADTFDPSITDFVTIGNGSMGGKARGLAFFATRLQWAVHPDSILAEVNVCVPQTCVITTDGFDDFIAANNFHPADTDSDESIAERFLAGTMPDWLQSDLRAFLKEIDYPLSVRSSSMLEDVQFRPYAGLYNTFMLGNNNPDFEVRLEQLVQAVKLVYASTWFESPRAFSRSIGQLREDSMAVIIQKLTGTNYGQYIYPAISGVVQSYNYYPVEPMRAEDGVAHIALGFGKTVVEGERSLRFSPGFPGNLPQFSTVDDILANSQRYFYSLACFDQFGFSRRDSNLVRRDIEDALHEYPVRLLSSTYMAEEHSIRDADIPGYKVITFAALLKYNLYPLPQVLSELLAYGREGLGCEVEIEFSLDLHQDPLRSTFYFLQIRPIVTGSDSRKVRIKTRERHAAFLHSTEALGHGLFEKMEDILYVVPEHFDGSRTKEIGQEIGKMNRLLAKQKKSYLLVGPGRWGTADPWLGIPVLWGDISGVGAIVELQGTVLQAEPSQGSHFFQNITSLGIPYLMINEQQIAREREQNENKVLGGIDWQFLKSQDVIEETKYVKHVRLPEPFILKVDGQSSEAVAMVRY